jgi:two-component system OmpR family response regulator
MNILIVNSDDKTANILALDLRQRGHQAHCEKSGLIAFSLPIDNSFDAILIDDSLPYLRGTEVAQHLRRRNVRKPIVLTTRNDSIGHRRVAETCGVDDFLIKPVSAAEIEAHIEAILRPVVTRSNTYRMCVGDLEVDRGLRTVICGERCVPMTRMQILVLWKLAEQADSVVSRDTLYSTIWKYGGATHTKLSSMILTIRRRLTAAGLRDPIKTVRGGGYMLKTEA